MSVKASRTSHSIKPTNLKSGEIMFSDQGAVIQTVLGSCVAYCVFDKVLNIGGMVHYLLPAESFDVSVKVVAENGLNFGSVAIPKLLQMMKAAGSEQSNLEVTILGGGSHAESQNKFGQQVGVANIEIAEALTKSFGLMVKGRRVRQEGPLQVQFNCGSGEVLVKRQPQTGHGRALISIPAHQKQKNFKKEEVRTANIETNKSMRILLVDKAPTFRRILKATLSRFAGIEVVGEAGDLGEAVRLFKTSKPTVVTLDAELFEGGDFSFLELVKNVSVPVIIVSVFSEQEASPVMKALELGAFDFIEKPNTSEIMDFGKQLKDLMNAALAGSRMERRRPMKAAVRETSSSPAIAVGDCRASIIGIGASTGGTEALREVMARLPEKTPPILIVQHMPAQFTKVFAEGLNAVAKVRVTEAKTGDVLEPSHAYLAPGGKQMRIRKIDEARYMIECNNDAPVNRFKPSVDYLFKSILGLGLGNKVHAALLTGMGDDGARGLLELKRAGGFTIAQDRESCVVYGMPKVAAELGAATIITDLDNVAMYLMAGQKLTGNR